MIGGRVRLARLAAGLSQDEVADRLHGVGLGITKAALSKYERGKSTPGAAFLLKLGEVLGVSAGFFLKEPSVSLEWCAFRKKSTMTKKRQEMIKAYAEKIVENQMWLQTSFHPGTKPEFPQREEVRNADDVESLALWLRERWKLGYAPIESVTQSVEDQGGIVVGRNEDLDDFDGLAGWANGVYPVIVMSLKVPDDRRRFDLAHEIGHLIVNRYDNADAEKDENLAHRFAAAFLVPAEVARWELGQRRKTLNLNEVAILKEKYGLSMQAWIRRAFDLDIIKDGHYKTLCRQFSRLGWRKKEPVDFNGNEEPSKLKQMTLRALAEGIISEKTAQEICPGCTEDVAATRALRPGRSAREIMRLPRKERTAILAAAAASAEEEYRTNRELTAFDAFGEDDLDDGTE